MNIEAPKFDGPHKLLTPWWDAVVHYFTVAMMAISVSLIGLQTTDQDKMICIPVVNCSALARNQSVLWAPNTTDQKINVSGKPSCEELNERQRPTTILTTMADRRQYDYVESKCYSKLPAFRAFFSLIFFGEALLLLVITNYWYPATNHFETLLAEFSNDGELLSYAFSNTKERIPKVAFFNQKLLCFQQQNGKEPTDFHSKITSASFQYKFRVRIACVLSIGFALINITLFCSRPHNECHLQTTFLTEYIIEYFECSRPIDRYYDIVVYIFSGLLILTFFVLARAFVWTVQFSFSDTDEKVLLRMLKAAGKTRSLSRLCHEGISHLIKLLSAADEVNPIEGEDIYDTWL